ncbi:hypothetical protein LINGRAHAP2_LOCUS31247 [Linum grandiflorum]
MAFAMFSCNLIRLQQFRPLLARTRAIYVIALVLRKLVGCFTRLVAACYTHFS